MNPWMCIVMCGCQAVAPPPPATAPPPAVVQPADRDSADAILDRMEVQGRTLKEFTAAASMEKFEALTEEREIRRGRVVVVGPSGAAREIAVIFDETIDSSGRGSTDSRLFLFSAGWMSEFDMQRKQVVRRQLARAGETFDPLRVGEGLFPVPLGQPKADVLREFTVSLGAIPSAPFFKSLIEGDRASTIGGGERGNLIALRMVPRAGTTMARDTAAIVMVMQSDTLTPRAVEVEAVNGDRTRVLLRSAAMNQGLDEAARTLLRGPSTDGWKIDSRPLP